MNKFDATFNINQQEKFNNIANGLYIKFAFFPTNMQEDKITYSIGYIGEDEEEYYRFQETLMEHIDEIHIEEVVNGNN
jgi:hypothetical protein